MKFLKSIITGAALVLGMSAGAQQFGQFTTLLFPTNSANIAGQNVFSISTPVNVPVPTIPLNIVATNASTLVTNILVTVITATNTTTFVYSAATMGTNFSTNFPAYTAQATATTTAWAFPQLLAGAVTNVVQIK